MTSRSSPFRFSSLLVYTPRRHDPSGLGAQARRAAFQVKAGRPPVLERLAVVAREHSDELGVFGPNVTAVPIPRSSPRPPKMEGFQWTPLWICQALEAAGLVRDVKPLLYRIHRVTQAHRSSAGERPTVQEHVDSLWWDGDFGTDLGSSVLLVDDFVTRGSTFLAAREVISEVQPGLDVHAFAAVRTMSGEVVTEPVAPVVGSISIHWDDRGIRRP